MSKLARQIAAAKIAANANIAGGGSPFYYEQGTKSSGNTPIWSGSFGGTAGAGTIVLPSTAAGVFSVSKSIYAIYNAQVQALTATDFQYLAMLSGYDTANGATCNQDNVQTVDQCLLTFGTGNPQHIGKYSYDSMHFQRHADLIAAVSLGSKTRSQLITAYLTTLGFVSGDLSMSSPTIAGGVVAKPTTLRAMAQKLMNGTYTLKAALQDNVTWAPVNASVYFTDGSVVLPNGSPAPSNQPWKYKWGHWIEPDTGYIWWAGSGGTVLWMDPTFTNYGLLFRVADTSGGEMGVQSIFAAQAIREAFLQGGNKWLARSKFGLGWVPGIR